VSEVTIGSIIAGERYERGYSRRQVCQGLCSTQMLIKIEKDDAETDKFVLDMLLQRLGKSPDKLESIIADEEYKKIYSRKNIEVAIWKKQLNEARTLLKIYETKYARKNTVHEMFVLRNEAYIALEIEDNVSYAEELIQKAINKTLPGINQENMLDYLLATSEIENILFLVICYIREVSLSAIWENPPLHIWEMRKEMHLNREKCKKCEKKIKCKVIQDCRLYAEKYSTDEKAENPMTCFIAGKLR